MKILTLVGALVLLVAVGARADDRTPHGKVERFLDALIEHKIKQAYDDLMQDSPIAEKEEDVEELRKQTEIGLKIYGKPMGYEMFKEERFGASIVRIVVIQKFERHPLAWEFYFYKAKDDWILSNVKFSDRYETILRNR